MTFDIKKTKIPGCYEIIPMRFRDERGSFTKTFHKDIFLKNDLEVQFAEDFYSISQTGVIRGLHFQLPPNDHVKMVYCLSGEVMDVVVDLRVGSRTYGLYETFELTAEKANIVYIPRGLAHGFYVCEGPAIVVYKASTVHAPETDYGLHWDSLNIPWPNRTPIISQRDSRFPPFHQFSSPFSFQEE
ncbi:dTDP-4-dehydrorhamnose 3,5-epimerase [Brevibacillus choshinensis]|uniref:dTDP-4-dehydrorhamnose 3,5-epimerase n=1 Tax=Brevibacillus choshinensis TaxID=54911 RepID=UPI00399CF9C1